MHDGPHFQFIHDRCKHLSVDELHAAERRFAEYLDLVASIVDRQMREDRAAESSSPLGAQQGEQRLADEKTAY